MRVYQVPSSLVRHVVASADARTVQPLNRFLLAICMLLTPIIWLGYFLAPNRGR